MSTFVRRLLHRATLTLIVCAWVAQDSALGHQLSTVALLCAFIAGGWWLTRQSRRLSALGMQMFWRLVVLWWKSRIQRAWEDMERRR